MASTMKAFGVGDYGDIDAIIEEELPKPEASGRDLLVRVMASAINPADTKVRARRYDDYPDYYDRVPRPFQVMGYEGSGIVEGRGPDCQYYNVGDRVFFAGSPIRQGADAEYILVDERSCGRKPQKLDFAEAGSMPLTYITAYEALIERMEIKPDEKAGLLIINGAGGVGAMASQIAKKYLRLPAVVTTASRPETIEFTKKMSATHVINHREDLRPQIKDLKLDVPIKYIFITHSTDRYMHAVADICHPFGKVCSIVQGQARMYGTQFMSKSLSFHWCVIGTKPYHGVNVNSHHEILEELADLVDSNKILCTLTKRLPLTLEGVKESHRQTESSTNIGKVGLVALGMEAAESHADLLTLHRNE
ncbi:hypothetical protein KEM55_005260 [Ascosphaera atra]|nr:hypothetical protein KEM55_005260 [Ascosphaera atra]